MNNTRIGLLLALIAVLVIGLGAYTMTSGQDEVVEANPETNPRPKDLPPGLQAAIHAEAVEQLREQKRMTTTFSSGVETAGMIVTLGGKSVTLPDDVYMDGIVVTMSCIEGAGQCPEVPAMILRYVDSDDLIGVSIHSGKIIENRIPGDEADWDRLAQRFKWLFDILGEHVQ